jgi:hypothetical protein
MVEEIVLWLSRALYPRGRAFKMPEGGFLEGLHKALAISEARAFEDACKFLFDILPDNDNFSEKDAASWERRLGLIVNDSVPLEDRKLAIKRKINFPGTIKARQNWRYLQGQLQAAGFDVYVHENRFPDGMGGYTTMDPLTITGGVGAGSLQYGDVQYGDVQYGATYANIIANHLDENTDRLFSVGENLRSTFFIGGSTLGDFANVNPNKKDQFRQLILKIKPAHTVGFLFINYV